MKRFQVGFSETHIIVITADKVAFEWGALQFYESGKVVATVSAGCWLYIMEIPSE